MGVAQSNHASVPWKEQLKEKVDNSSTWKENHEILPSLV
jgi:hypothetical protein